MDFTVPANRRVKLKEVEKKDKYLDLAEEAMEHEGNGDTNCNWCTWNNPQRLGKGTVRLRIKGRVETIYNTKIGQNTEKSPGDLRRFAVSQTSVKSHQLTLL